MYSGRIRSTGFSSLRRDASTEALHMERNVYSTQQPDGTIVTTMTQTRTKYEEDTVYGCGRGQLNKHYCMGPHGALRVAEIFLCLVVISLITSVFGPGPFKGVLFGQTILLIFAGVAMCLTFIFLIVYFFTLNETHLDFWPWRITDLVFSATSAVTFIILCFLEAYYSTGAWSNNCNDIGSDGIIHNGCQIIYEWAFAAFFCFILSCLYAISAFFAYRNRYDLRGDRDY